MLSDTVIRVESLGKRYRIGRHNARDDTLVGTVSNALRTPGKNLRRLRRLTNFDPDEEDDVIWALRDVSFEVARGEVLGIIGANGAGKSTLLKILSRITYPTLGRFELHGRVSSLLEVGTGFHPELTGRENIYLNGSILGMRKNEIARKFDQIVDFSGVEKFIDTPVKRYSSGMRVRLAFSVAAHLEPEILLIDEVLAVGDARFQKKSLGKMSEVSNDGRTVLFVSHNLTAIQSVCRSAMLLQDGQIDAIGNVSSIASKYLKASQAANSAPEWPDVSTAPGNDLVRINRIDIYSGEDSDFLTMQKPIYIDTVYWVLDAETKTHLTYHLISDSGIIVLTTGSPVISEHSGKFRAQFALPGDLLNSGDYYLKLLIVSNDTDVVYIKDHIATFSVHDVAKRGDAWLGREPGVVQPTLEWKIEELPP